MGAHFGYCSATIPMEKDIGDEYQWSIEHTSTKTKNIEAKEITSDPDSSAYRAAENVPQILTEPEHFLDEQTIKENL